jgi:hypothetical protein
MIDIKETVDHVAGLLLDYAKAKNFSPAETMAIRSKVHEAIFAVAVAPNTATACYERVCSEFLDKTTQVRGLPVRTIFSRNEAGSGGAGPELVSASGRRVVQQFDKLLPKLKERLTWCVENYRAHATEYFNDQIDALFAVIDDFLTNTPRTVKERGPKISAIKKEIRYLARWDSLVYTWQAATFPNEVEYIFRLGLDPADRPIGAVWHYSALDEQGDYRKTYDHKPRDDVVYLVEDSWAMQEGFIVAEPERLLSRIDLPKRAIGCMCSLRWFYTLGDVPPELLTDAGRTALKRAEKALTRIMAGEPLKDAANQPKPKSWLRRLFGS